MKLHYYQQKCLTDLRKFFEKTEEFKSVGTAFYNITDRQYYSPPSLPESMPYICIRVPTGGGKTLMAAHAVGIAADFYRSENPLCLWLAPSNSIVEQTLKLLKNRDHPCRRALAESFKGRINCISIKEAMRINKSDLETAATIIVCTVQTLRAEKTEGRKVYDSNGSLMTHFDSLPVALKSKLRRDESGVINYSLDNVLQLHRPIIISDEAHNSSTKLSYQTLERFNPSCIIEWTATPQVNNNPAREIYPSNVLSHVSAIELKSADMVKLPINLEVISDWHQNIQAAIEKQNELEKEAQKLEKETGEYIRPIVLYQAQNVGSEVEAESIRSKLINEFKIPTEQVIVHTGSTRELKNHDLLIRKCPLRHIITVRALAEGWDCSFAYILCTMANFQASNPVEQILGRILRLPNAKPKSIASLNESYAFIMTDNFRRAVSGLEDALINGAGYHKMETRDLIVGKDGEPLPLFRNDIGGNKNKQKKINPLVVPYLAVCENGKLEFLDGGHFLGVEWSIAKEKPNISAFAFPTVKAQGTTVDVKDGKVVHGELEFQIDIREQLMLLSTDKNWTESSLTAWLDNAISHLDIPKVQSSPYILAAVRGLLNREEEMNKIAHYRFDIKVFLENEIKKLRLRKRKEGLQELLSNMSIGGELLEVSPQCAFTFDSRQYTASEFVEYPEFFKKHIFPEKIGKLNGEEHQCADYLDGLSEVEIWVRNVEKQKHSFWLQTSTDRFYPDFVCRLNDGRILVVEYKGADRWSDEDSQEKRNIGEVWAKLSDGKCLFVMPKGKDLQAINKCIAQKT